VGGGDRVVVEGSDSEEDVPDAPNTASPMYGVTRVPMHDHKVTDPPCLVYVQVSGLGHRAWGVG
jgi:hypothetical protein